jgi:hypothetical protein
MSSVAIEFINDVQYQELALINLPFRGISVQFLPEPLFTLNELQEDRFSAK